MSEFKVKEWSVIVETHRPDGKGLKRMCEVVASGLAIDEADRRCDMIDASMQEDIRAGRKLPRRMPFIVSDRDAKAYGVVKPTSDALPDPCGMGR